MLGRAFPVVNMFSESVLKSIIYTFVCCKIALLTYKFNIKRQKIPLQKYKENINEFDEILINITRIRN